MAPSAGGDRSDRLHGELGRTAPHWAGGRVTPLSVPTVLAPRVIGTAVARYNFAARDMRELSLREGDVVKIYSRMGGDQGWWRGETNGKVSGRALPPCSRGGPGRAARAGTA